MRWYIVALYCIRRGRGTGGGHRLSSPARRRRGLPPGGRQPDAPALTRGLTPGGATIYPRPRGWLSTRSAPSTTHQSVLGQYWVSTGSGLTTPGWGPSASLASRAVLPVHRVRRPPPPLWLDAPGPAWTPLDSPGLLWTALDRPEPLPHPPQPALDRPGPARTALDRPGSAWIAGPGPAGGRGPRGAPRHAARGSGPR